MMNYLIKLLFIVFFFSTSNIYALEKNRIIFKIGDEVFSLIDLEERNNYLKLLNENKNVLSKDNLLKDLISINLFLISNKKNILNIYDYKLKLYEQFFKKYEKYEKKNEFKIIFETLGKEKIYENLEKDIIRKQILQNLLNQKKDLIISEGEKLIVDIFDINIHYFSFDNKNYQIIKENFQSINPTNIDQFKKKLKKNNITYLEKNKKIINFNNINNKIKENILHGDKYFIIKNNNSKIIGLIIKKINIKNTNVKFNFFHVFSKKKINKNFLKCDTIKNNKNKNFEINEIKSIDIAKLNNKIKDKFMNINDYAQIQNSDGDVYLILCSIDFDKNKQKQLNINTKMEDYLQQIEKDFIKNKSKELKLFYND